MPAAAEFIESVPPSNLSFSEVRKHSRPEDCWIVVHSKVYDVSEFLDKHPGGSAIILKFAGGDATNAFDEIHAPGIIDEGLAKESLMGTLTAEDVVQLLPATAEEETKAQSVVLPPSLSSKPYQKPELSKLISVHDFEEVARQLFSQKAYAFYSSAATDLVTHHANSQCYRQIMMRPRVLRNVKEIRTRRKILGHECEAPFFVSPAAMARLAHPEGELAMARGCGDEGIIHIISSNASYPLASIVESGLPGQPFFLQLYVNSDRSKSAELLQKARRLGIKAICLTVDAPVPGKREADERIAAENISSAMSGAVATNDKKGGGLGRVMARYIDSTLNWDDIAWIKETSRLPVILKGIQCASDARKAVEYGVEGILLSNHGGRSLDTAQPSIITLLELHKVCPEVFDKLEVYVDGGITRGVDILKALALGATAVGIGRPYLYSLAYGAEGVRHLTQILKDELITSMKLCGITDVDQAHPGLINTANVDFMVPSGDDHPYVAWRPKAKL